MEELYLFILCYLLVFCVYYIFIVRKYFENNKKSSKKRKVKKKVIDKADRRPMEVNFLIYKYKLNLKKINYNKLLWIICFVSTFDISLIVSLISLSDNYFIEIGIGIISVIPIILISYGIVGCIYRKRGYCND